MVLAIFRACCCFLRAIPVIFITTIVVWSYYAYVIQICLFTINSIPQKVIYLIIYHLLITLFLWSFWKIVFTSPKKIPAEFYLPLNLRSRVESLNNDSEKKSIINEFARSLPVHSRFVTGDFRFCDKCFMVKPDRAHHCSLCQRCILKMDHHCPWVNNCVCLNNYKFFVLFLFYGLLYCTFVAATSIQFFILFWKSISQPGSDMSNLHTVFVFFVSIMFAISLIALLSYHIYLVAVNKTTIETYQTPYFGSGVQDKNVFNVGFARNFKQVFGQNAILSFFPVSSSELDGINYETRLLNPPSYHSTQPTQFFNETDSHLAISVFGDESTKGEDSRILLDERQHQPNLNGHMHSLS